MNQHSSNLSPKKIDGTGNESPFASERLVRQAQKQNLDSDRLKAAYVSDVDVNDTEFNNNYLNYVDFTEANLTGKISSCF